MRFTQIVLVPLAFVFIFLFHPDLAAAHLRRLCALGTIRVAVPQAVSPPHARRRDPRMNRALRSEYLAALGLESWTLRSRPAVGVPSGGVSGTPPESGVEHLDWPELRAAVAACTRCTLEHEPHPDGVRRRKPQAEWLIVGEAPGAEEDRQGEPFVGRAGQLLNAMLRAIGLAREQVYIANVLKCRPPRNRDPAPVETAQCLPYLERQIALLKPKIMLAVGRISAQNLLKTDVSLGAPARAGASFRRHRGAVGGNVSPGLSPA